MTLNLQGQPGPSYVKSLQLGDQNVQETEIPISAGAAGPLKIVMGMKMGKIDGTVEGASGARIRDVFYRTRRRAGEPGLRGCAGAFSLGKRRAGRVPCVRAGGGGRQRILWENDDLRKALEGRSGKVSVEEGGTATVSLTVISREMLERVRQENE